MCGICGIINFSGEPVDKNQLKSMMKLMKHRGPDDEGIFLDENIGFGFVRLSIMDLSPLGHQPMFDETNRYMIIHNGEVYNFIEIREELKKEGYKFKSNTDTEVILYSYIEWSEDCLNKFNGMWAFVIYDSISKKIFCSRDRFGVKPFYYYLNNSKFIFASEIKPILSLLDNVSANNQIIFDYLFSNRIDHTEDTFFLGIKKLQHGNKINISTNAPFKFQKKSWYILRNQLNNSIANKEEMLELLLSSIKFQLRSDVPLGACFSGGLDSSAIVSIILKKNLLPEINSFSAVYSKDDRADESYYINCLRDSNLSKNFVFPTADGLYNDIENLMETHPEPFPDTSIYAGYKVMELASKKIKVLLDGQGADEQFAGYLYFYGYYLTEIMKKRNYITVISELFYWTRKHSVWNIGLATYFFLLLPNYLKTKLLTKRNSSISKNFFNEYYQQNNVVDLLYQRQSLNESLICHFEYKLEHLLKWEDLNSMKFGLEARVPFLDHRIVEKVLASPSNFKFKNGWTKFILRESLSGILPLELQYRSTKIGFETPEKKWLEHPSFQVLLSDILNSNSFKQRDIFSVKMNQSFNNSKIIWKILNLELWFRKYIDKNN